MTRNLHCNLFAQNCLVRLSYHRPSHRSVGSLFIVASVATQEEDENFPQRVPRLNRTLPARLACVDQEMDVSTLAAPEIWVGTNTHEWVMKVQPLQWLLEHGIFPKTYKIL